MTTQISIGCNCAPALALKNLGLKTETMPFDWTANTLKIVIDCLRTDFHHYSTLGKNPNLPKSINEEICRFLDLDLNFQKRFNPEMVNYYGNWYPHTKAENPQELRDELKRRSERMINLLNSDQKILFIFGNEHGLYLEPCYSKQDEYYEDLLLFEDLILHKYNKTDFRILALFIGKKYPNTKHIICHSYPSKNLSKNLELHIDPVWDAFRLHMKLLVNDTLTKLKDSWI